MISVSPGLKAELQKLRGRRLRARVQIDYSDANIDNTVEAWANTTARHAALSQVHNGKEDVSAKWASLDGSWVLDGTYALAPETEEELSEYEIGWWSEELSLADGTFADEHPPLLGDGGLLGDGALLGPYRGIPELHVNFLPRTISDIRIAFDNARVEYAVDFQVIITDAAGAVLNTTAVTGNAGVKYAVSITPVNLAVQMTLRITKWSAGSRQAKVAEMLTAVSETYEGKDILSLRTIENREMSGNGVAIGQTASGECVISLFNRYHLFDYDNTESKLYNLVRKGNRITVWIGDGTEWVRIGVFYAREWDIAKRKLSVTVTGLDRMAMLDDSEFSTSKVIKPPSDQTFLVDTYAEWAAGTLVGVETVGDYLRLAAS